MELHTLIVMNSCFHAIIPTLFLYFLSSCCPYILFNVFYYLYTIVIIMSIYWSVLYFLMWCTGKEKEQRKKTEDMDLEIWFATFKQHAPHYIHLYVHDYKLLAFSLSSISNLHNICYDFLLLLWKGFVLYYVTFVKKFLKSWGTHGHGCGRKGLGEE